MTVSPWTEVQLAVGGALRLAIGDRRGLGAFDASIDGFWRSFRAGVICYPLYLLLRSFDIAAAQWEQSGVATILAVETIAYVTSWVAFPLVILPLAQQFGRGDRFLAFMVAYNWSQIPQTVLVVLVGLDGAAGMLPRSEASFASLLAIIATLVYEWYIARVALAVTGAQATLVVIVDVLLSTALGRVAEGLY
ncbi:MAG TPA: hypothetical protein VGS13_08150 [Stellaceae bacterium]|nr:hypothetical protein [Stellaceae bacterium]